MNTTPQDPVARMLNKVPAVTMAFWVIKIMATTVGETAADLLNDDLHLGLTKTTMLMVAMLVAALVCQFKKDRYVPWIYWISVVLISVVGTLITDNITDNLQVPLQVTTVIFSVALVVTFVVWHVAEKTLSIHTICSARREFFYWAAILFTFALGTAAGDLVAESFKIGYLHAALVFGAAIVVVSLAHALFKLDAVWSFWIAYILTRPFGASLGDLLAQPASNGGWGFGTVGTSAIFLAVIVGFVATMTIKQKQPSHAFSTRSRT